MGARYTPPFSKGGSGGFSAPNQKGSALLLFLLLIIVGASAFFVLQLGNNQLNIQRQNDSSDALSRAKTALLDYVTSTSMSPSTNLLPCPDLNNGGGFPEGAAHTTCGNVSTNTIGRLPFQTLGIDALRDGNGECLWYVVSGLHKQSPASGLNNADTNGLLTLHAPDQSTLIAGTSADDRAVALIIAPGSPVGNQVRNTLNSGVDQCQGNFNPANYLDQIATWNNAQLSGTANTVDAFITSDNTTSNDTIPFNDRIIAITQSELQAAIDKRTDLNTQLNQLTQSIAQCVANFGLSGSGSNDYRLPWPSSLTMTDYRDDNQYQDTLFSTAPKQLFGRVPDTFANMPQVLGLTGKGAGTLLSGCLTASQYTLWQNWKDHYFLAVGKAYEADTGTLPTANCNSTNCLTVDGGHTSAAVVIFSGKRLTTQTRLDPPVNDLSKAGINNYLEGRNATNFPDSSGNTDFETDTESSTFNDILYCITPQPDMLVTACDHTYVVPGSGSDVSFENNLGGFNDIAGTADYTITPAGANSAINISENVLAPPSQKYLCIWYDTPFEIENQTLRTYFEILLQTDGSNDSMGRCSGFTFAIKPGPDAAGNCGNHGAGLGFANMNGLGADAFAIEFDINESPSKSEPVYNHVAAVIDSNNRHNHQGNPACPSAGCFGQGSGSQSTITWLEDHNQYPVRIELHTGFPTNSCTAGQDGQGGNYALIEAWVDCAGANCTNFDAVNSDYDNLANTPLASHCFQLPATMYGDPASGGNGIRFGFTAAFGGCNSGPVNTDLTILGFNLDID